MIQQLMGVLNCSLESRWPDLQAFAAAFPERDGWSEQNYLGLIAYAFQRVGNKEKFAEAMSLYKADWIISAKQAPIIIPSPLPKPCTPCWPATMKPP